MPCLTSPWVAGRWRAAWRGPRAPGLWPWRTRSLSFGSHPVAAVEGEEAPSCASGHLGRQREQDPGPLDLAFKAFAAQLHPTAVFPLPCTGPARPLHLPFPLPGGPFPLPFSLSSLSSFPPFSLPSPSLLPFPFSFSSLFASYGFAHSCHRGSGTYTGILQGSVLPPETACLHFPAGRTFRLTCAPSRAGQG